MVIETNEPRYQVDYDHDLDMWCVFDMRYSESLAIATFCDREQAEEYAYVREHGNQAP